MFEVSPCQTTGGTGLNAVWRGGLLWHYAFQGPVLSMLARRPGKWEGIVTRTTSMDTVGKVVFIPMIAWRSGRLD
jgi:hypothetical protein